MCHGGLSGCAIPVLQAEIDKLNNDVSALKTAVSVINLGVVWCGDSEAIAVDDNGNLALYTAEPYLSHGDLNQAAMEDAFDDLRSC